MFRRINYRDPRAEESFSSTLPESLDGNAIISNHFFHRKVTLRLIFSLACNNATGMAGKIVTEPGDI